MKNLNDLIGDFSAESARTIAYYLIRYFKGALHIEEDGKDIFVDVFEPEADEKIRTATLEVIGKIEQAEGAPASKLNEAAIDRILDAITSFEESITEEPSEAHAAEAESFLGRTKSID
jgi:hypothetical protein